MSHKIKFLVENRQYTLQDLQTLSIDVDCVSILQSKGICFRANDNRTASFCFVGIVSYRDIIFCVLPKYNKCVDNFDENIKNIELIMRVLKKYSIDKSLDYNDAMFLVNDVDDEDVSDIALADYFIRDYIQYGFYQKEQEEVFLNAIGEVYWQKTIEQLYPYSIRKKPIYLDTYKIISIEDPYNYIKRIHQWAVNWGLNNYSKLLGYTNIDIGNHDPDDISELGSEEFLSSLLVREIQNAYSDRIITLLKALDALVKRSSYSSTSQNLSLYGTITFEYVWERVCGGALKNQYETFERYIPRPVWRNLDGYSVRNKSTLKPDIIKKLLIEDKRLFFIMDAKYYNISFIGELLQNNPGVQDVAKQLFYQKALEGVCGSCDTYNIFLFPSEDADKIKVFGTVNLDFFGFRPVILVYLSAVSFFNLYLRGDSLDNNDLIELASRIEDIVSS